MEIHQQAEVLVGALPYIQKYYGKIVVVKYGGNAMINGELKEAVMRDLTLLRHIGIKVVLIHGGGPEISQMLSRLGMQSRFVNGLRYTDKESAEVVQMVLAGKVNKDLVADLQRCGANAVGLCGIDGGIFKARQFAPELGYVGEAQSVNVAPILFALNNGYIPVIATVASGENGEIFNINADSAAAKLAEALKVENLILMTDIKGLLRDVKDENSLISEVHSSEFDELVKSGIISGGMIPKTQCCVECVRQGVAQAIIIDGRIKHAILIELLTDKGVGTRFRK